MTPLRPLPSAWQMLWLLTRLRLLRLVNLFGAVSRLSFGAKSKRDVHRPQRTGTGRKKGVGLLAGLFLGGMMLFGFGVMAKQSLRNLHHTLVVQAQIDAVGGADGVSEAGEKFRQTFERTAVEPVLLRATTGLIALLWVVAVCNDLGTRELARPEWDMEWLVTLPIRMPTLLWARLAERSVTSLFALLSLLPLLLVLAWQQVSPGWLVPLMALAAALPLFALAALLRSVVDIGLRLRLAPARLRNLQALMSVLGLLGLYLALSVGSSQGASLGVSMVSESPGWLLWTPPGLVVQALYAGTPWQALVLLFAAWAQAGLLLAAGVAWMHRQLRHGLLSGGSREAGTRGPGVARSARGGWQLPLRSPVQRRELLLLARDRNFLVQTLLLPVLIIGSQIVLNGGTQALGQLFSGPPALIASIAFGLASYMLMLSAFQTLNTEGAALWLLYTFPRSVGSVLRDKAALWAVIALAYPVGVLLPGALHMAPGAGWRYLGLGLLALAGVPLFSVIAVSLAVFASDPLAQERSARVRPGFVYLFMMLSGFYGYGLWAAAWWQSLVILLLVGLLALALWQKANDALPFLLDPVASPPAQPSVADGLIAATAFLVLQLMLSALWRVFQPDRPGAGVLVSFVAAGALTYGLARLVYWRAGVKTLPSLLGRAGQRSAAVREGLLWGAAAAGLGAAYLLALRQLLLMPEAGAAVAPALRIGLAWPCVLAAPVFEEFIFRGLIFAGLRRSFAWWPSAAASAAVFAVVHPPVSMIPVFFLGLCTAAAYERGRSLMAPMLVHAVYNAVVVGLQFGWPGR